MYQFTIIVPHKNIPILLRRCLDSIPHRDDLQIIVVDDNSNLSEKEYEKFPGRNEKNTEVYFTKKGRGAGYARNVGLEHAKGKWILFADADDIFLPEIENALNYASKTHADIIYLGVCSKDSETFIDNHEIDHVNKLLANNIEHIRYNIPPPWGKIFNRGFVKKHKLLFEEVKYSNDTRFSALCDYYAKDIKIYSNISYCYMYRKESLWHNKNIEWYETRNKVMLRMYQFMYKHNEMFQAQKYKEAAYYYLCPISKYSKKKYLLNLFLYGYYTKSYKIMFMQCSYIFLHHMLIKLKKSVFFLNLK